MCINILGLKVCVSLAEKMDQAARRVERFTAEDWFETARNQAEMLQVLNRR